MSLSQIIGFTMLAAFLYALWAVLAREMGVWKAAALFIGVAGATLLILIAQYLIMYG